MDQKILIGIGGGFIVGALAGGAGAFLYAKRYFKEQADNDIKEMADYYQRKYGELKEEKKDEKDIKEEVKEASIQSDIEKISSIYDKGDKTETVEHVVYTNYFAGSDNNSSSDNKKKKGGRKKKVVDPSIVSHDIWDNPPEGYDTRFLIYYDADGVMVDEETEGIVEDGEKLVGIDNLAQTDPYDNILIVKNDSEKTVYHVTVEQMAYSEVGGLDD